MSLIFHSLFLHQVLIRARIISSQNDLCISDWTSQLKLLLLFIVYAFDFIYQLYYF